MTYSAKITYLFHSGYAVETANHFLIFDYYEPRLSKPPGKITGESLKNKKNVFVFSSHSHADHFDSAILEWAKDNPAITYIFSNDITSTPLVGDCHLLAPYQNLAFQNLNVQTFGSTDIGVSFLAQADGLSIFHAGDLNWWHWKGDTKVNQEAAEKMFKAEIAKLAGTAIDIAFFPVDRRLEEFYAKGAEYFAEILKPKLLLPMHFGRDYSATAAFAAKLTGAVKTYEITHKGQEFYY